MSRPANPGMKHGPGKNHGPAPKIENPGKLLNRLLQYVSRNYKYHILVVIVCIFISVLANVQGTMFMKSLIDDYITPLL